MTRAATPERYRIEPYDYAQARRLSSELGVSLPVAATLVRRGYGTAAEARTFLEASESHDPFAFEAMDEVVGVLLGAVERRRRITVHGDYDADGVCATAILVGALRELGADADWYLPSRQEDGYGLTAAGVERIAQRGTAVLVTADCGIGCPAEVRAARELEMEVIVTDHHEPGPELPDCPILHPRLGGYPFPELCATGVAHKLATALRSRRGAPPGGDLDLVALATVADLVPLRGENRALVRAGLAQARRAERPGLRALMAAAAIEPGRLDEGDFAFRLAPRINAAGRLYRADAGVELMLTSDHDRAEGIARELDRANRERRAAELEALAGAEAALRELPGDPADCAALVVAGEGWHAGVVGIVASRLVERYWRPSVVIALDSSGRGRGSARSIPGFDLLSALHECSEHLARFGGHEMAAGLEIEAGRIPGFRDALDAHARANIAPTDLLRAETVDAVVGGESLGQAIAEELELLAPFGKGNPEVTLLVPGARIRDVRPMGEGKHARFSVVSGRARALGVAFGVNGSLSAAPDEPHDLSVKLEVHTWNGADHPRVVLRELYPNAPGDRDEEGAPCRSPAAGEEWWRRFDAELDAPLEGEGGDDPSDEASSAIRRESIDRLNCSAVACIADLLSSGVPVLAVCADAARRRGLAERAADPRRFGGGEAAHICGRCTDDAGQSGVEALLASGRGLALADWSALARHPKLASRFEHVVVVDPAPFASLEALVARGSGYMHLAWGQPELDLAMRVHELDWPRRAALAGFFRELREACLDGAPLEGDALADALGGEGRHPRSAAQAARRCRVLAELGLLAWEGTDIARSLRVVSSEATDLERSVAYRAYRERFEEGKRFLSTRRAPR